MLNEIAWAQAELQQPPNPSTCNSSCQMQHDSFLLRIQQADSAMSSSGSILPGRKLLQLTRVEMAIQTVGGCKNPCDVRSENCCIHIDGGGTPKFDSCPPFAPNCEVYADPPSTPSPCGGAEMCDQCSAADGTACADIVRDDLPSTRITGYDCVTCDNTATARTAAASGGGSGPSADAGTIIENVLKIGIALLA